MKQARTFRKPHAMLEVDTHYCAGCGHGVLHRILAELIDELDLRGRLVGIAPVGCAVLAYNYLDIDMSEAAHGRVPAVATGIKRARPELLVFGYQGDGDLASIGTAEIIHAANRGENYTTIFVNNGVYGMTGGQMAPTTLPGQRTATSPNGRDTSTMGFPLRMCELLNTLHNPYLIVRTALDGPAGIRSTKKWVREGLMAQIQGKGFSFIEVLSACPTYCRVSPEAALEHLRKKVKPYFPTGVFRPAPQEAANA
ncbi:MAG: 2-oxoglutarate oxidoreductase [Candidatus Glassbacteria bacterium]|nr:2-oxoglutarate oxidoreductase [Candidatus Glassbacteria bacterium]